MQTVASPGSRNPEKADAGWPPVVVGGAFQSGLNLMRDLLRRGVQVIAVDYDLTHHGFRSVYGKTVHCPNPDLDGPLWLQFMKDLSVELGQKPVFIPAADAFVMALGRYAPELADHYLNSPEAARLQAELSSKDTQYELCAKFGYPCPRLAHVESAADLERFMEGARFPCLIKPLSPRAWDSMPQGNAAYNTKIVMAESAAELRAVYATVAPFEPAAIAMEVIAGLGSQKHDYLATFGDGGRLLGECLVKHFHAYPVFTGMPSVVRPVQNPKLTKLCREFMEKLRYRGICEFEFKLDERDGEPLLIEINPRFSGTGDAASYAGIETGWLHYLDAIGYPVSPVEPANFDYYHIALKIEATDSPAYVMDGLISWKEFLAPYRGQRAFFDFDWHDRRLAMQTLGLTARYLAGAVGRHMRLKLRVKQGAQSGG